MATKKKKAKHTKCDPRHGKGQRRTSNALSKGENNKQRLILNGVLPTLPSFAAPSAELTGELDRGRERRENPLLSPNTK